MKRIHVLAVFAIIISITSFCQAKDFLLNSKNGTNVYYESEKIALRLTSYKDFKTDLNVKIDVKDMNGEIVQKNSIKIGDLQTSETAGITLPKMKCGYYTVILSISQNKTELEKDFLKIAVIRETKKSLTEDSPFAVDAFTSWRLENTDDVERISKLIQKTGVKWVRDRISWGETEPEKGKWDFSRYNYKQKLQNDAGLEIFQVFHDTAPWASEITDRSRPEVSKVPPANFFDMYNFMRKGVSQYSKYVQAWEMWNEFDIPVFFTGKADEYAEILKTCYNGIKKEDESKIALLGSVTFGSGAIKFGTETYNDDEGEIYIHKIFDNGAGDYFDIFNLHHYGPVGGIVDKIRRCKKIMEKYNCKKPIWITETGSTSTDKMTDTISDSEINQAEYLAKAYLLSISEGVEKIFYFSFPLFIEHGISNWGVIEIAPDRWQPKPSYPALANMINTLSGYRFAGRLKYVPENINAFVFENKVKTVVTLFSADDSSHTQEIMLSEKCSIKKRDLFGNETDIEPSGSISMIVNKTPYYLVFDSMDAISGADVIIDENMKWKPEKKDKTGNFLKEVVLSTRTTPGDISYNTKTVSGKTGIYSFSDEEISGEIRITASYGKTDDIIKTEKITLTGMNRTFAEWEYNITPQIIATLRKTGEELKITSEFFPDDSGKYCSPSVRYLKCRSPFSILPENFTEIINDRIKAFVSVKCEEGMKGKAVLALEKLPSTFYPKSGKFNLLNLNGKEDEHKIPITFEKVLDTLETPNSLSFVYSILCDDIKTTYTYRIETQYVSKKEKEIIIDGCGDDWSSYKQYSLKGADHVVIGKESYKGDSDTAADFAMTWDKDNFYLFAEITDDNIRSDAPVESPWRGDAVELFMDFRDKDNLGGSKYDKNVFQIFVIPPVKYHPEAQLLVWQPAKTRWNLAKYKIIPTMKGYNLELAIPWYDLGVKYPEPGMQFGFDFVADDIDSGEFEHVQSKWRGTPNNWRDPSGFAQLILAGQQDNKKKN